MRVQSLGT